MGLADYHLADHILKNNGIEDKAERDAIQLKTAATLFAGVSAAAALALAVETTDTGSIPVDSAELSVENTLVIDDSLSR